MCGHEWGHCLSVLTLLPIGKCNLKEHTGTFQNFHFTTVLAPGTQQRTNSYPKDHQPNWGPREKLVPMSQDG